MITLNDSVQISGTRMSGDGYLVADVRVARSGIQEYAGYEVDPDGSLGFKDKAVVRLYRPPEEVFHTDAMRSYAYRPITNDHPSEPVNSENWKKYSVGQTGGEVARDGDWIRVPMVLMDAAQIREVQGGKRQLSMGYQFTLDATAGVSPEGEPYDAIQRTMRMNHLAVVLAARAGPDAKVGDDKPGNQPITQKEDSMSTKTIVLGDEAVDVADKDESKVLAFKAKTQGTIDALNDQIKNNQAAFDTQLAAKDAEIDALKAKVMDTKAIDAAVAERSTLIAAAKVLAPKLAVDGLSNDDIRKAVVVEKVGDSMKDKSTEYLRSRFDHLVENVTKDAGHDQTLSDSLQTIQPNTGDAKAAYEEALKKANANLNSRFAK